MAVLSRRKRAIAQGWDAINKQREEANKPKEIEKEEITEEDHKERVDLLKEIGVLKE